MAVVELNAGRTSVVVAVDAGGRIAQIVADGQDLLADDERRETASTGWGAFPMAPWAGRIREGRFVHGGVVHQLGRNHRDGPGDDRHHAIHGTVFTRPWAVDRQTDDTLEAHCPLEGALDWPFAGTARQQIVVGDGAVTCTLSVETDRDVFPAEVGWHPWFRKPESLTFRPTAMYRRDDSGVTVDELLDPSPGPWDDCFLNTEPVTLHYDRPLAPDVVVMSDCAHWVVYDEPDHATCVEPQSGPPDAFNLRPRFVRPGSPLRRTMTIEWSPITTRS